MQEQQLFEYAVLRVVPRIEREEFLNIGLIVFCKKLNYLGVLYHLDKEKITAVSPLLDIDCLADSLASLKKISDGDPLGGPIAKLDTASRFRWLTAVRSTILQSSRVHPGLSKDPAATLVQLFEKLVL
jgi:hypothetical protein